MDAKITKQRISRMLSYDWLKIIGIIVALIVGWTLIFTTTATRVMPTQQFTIFSYYCNAPMSSSYYTRQDALLKTEKIFSHEVLEINTYDLSTGKDMYATMLQTRLATNEADIIFIPKVTDTSVSVVENEETKYPYTYVDTFFAGYAWNVFEIQNYLAGMDTWLDGWYEGDHTVNEVNAEKIKSEFIARVTQKKDKRYKNDAQKQAGANLEVERIQKYKSAYDVVTQALADGKIQYERVQYKDANGAVVLEGNYALNLCPDVNVMGKMKDWYVYNAGKNEAQDLSAKDMCVLFFDMPQVDNTYEYEGLVYVAKIINDCLSASNA